MIHGGRDRERDIFNPQLEYEKKDVTHEEISKRISEWDRQLAAHPGELILVYDARPPRERHSRNSSEVGKILENISAGQLIDGQSGVFLFGTQVTDDRYISFGSNDFRDFDHPLRLGEVHALHSLQTYKEHFSFPGDEPKPVVEVVIGNEAVEKWFREGQRHSTPYQYYRVCKMFDVDPIQSDELTEALLERKGALLSMLIGKALEIIELSEGVQAVYDSVGGEPKLTGGAISIPPQEFGLANVMTYGKRTELEWHRRKLDEFKQEFVDLGGTEKEIGVALVKLSGLELPGQPK